MGDDETIGRLAAELDTLLGQSMEEPGDSCPATSASVASRVAERPARVLVIDDNRDYRELVRTVLSDQGYQVVQANDGSEGLGLVLDQPPDLIIVDFNMPRRNGYEFVQEMKSTLETRGIPIIMFSGAPNRRHIKDLGLDLADFLDKPVSNAKLLAAVQRVLPATMQEESAASEPPPAPTAPDKPGLAPRAASAAETPPAVEPEGLSESWQDDEALLDLVKIEKEERPEAEDLQGLDLESKNSPLISKVNQILVRAVGMRASDIHIEPQEDQILVRVRVDGSLRNLCTLPVSLRARLAARIKIMANLIITEHRLPQDGQFQAQIKNAPVEFRVSTLPSCHGEKIVMRILGASKLNTDLRSLGLSDRDFDCVEKTLKSPNGLVLVTGPTGSGKTTTLYTMMGVLNSPDVNILTAEDPIEYRLKGATQAQIRPAIGLTFETALRAFLRQDPDIMLIGEIRDKETAEIAVKASITGHLVFSTLHTNSAPATIMRLTHMGLASFLVAASVRLVVAQRLVKLLCPACKIPQPLSDEDKRSLTEDQIARLKTVFRPRGCPACRQAGYAGRRPIFEVMPVATSGMRQAILSREGSSDLLTDLAVKEGMTPLGHAALLAAADGLTSLHEAYPIIFGG
ncbi:MAG: Flp pilus assembly complex ATPase component TadA [Elusimicrobia bacterium]|nr:Flp pilus assembly complex ATPase component TadA [Elusimicrobiota bacterium]